MARWTEAGRRLGLPVAAILVAVVSIVGILGAAQASGTLGYDYLNGYDPAIRRFFAGQPIYDMRFTQAGPAGLFIYPIPFLIVLVPFAVLLPPEPAAVAWTIAMVAAFLAGVAVLPTRHSVRWATLLLSSLAWPVVYSLKLGQVAGLLFLLFAIGWRYLSRDAVVGTVTALATLIKVQPALLLGWALAQRRWGALLHALAVFVVLGVGTMVVVGVQPWIDFSRLLVQVSDPIAMPHNFTPGAIAYLMGAPLTVASGVQLASTVSAVVVLVLLWLRGSIEIAYLATIVVSQLASPILWEHYALLLMLPVAWFLERGAWAAALIPLAVAWPLTSITPPVVYPLLYAAVLLGLAVAAASRPAARSLRVVTT